MLRVKIKIGKITLVDKQSIGSCLLFIWFLNVPLQTVLRFFLTRLSIYGFARNVILFSATLVPIILFFVCIRSVSKKYYRHFFAIYIAVVLMFLYVYIDKPEMRYFITRADYGLPRVLYPDSAIFAFLFFSLCSSIEELFEVVKKFVFIDFGYLLLFQFIPAYINGGWSDISYDGTMVLRSYSLSFGYNMLLPAIFFLYLYLKGKKICYLVLSCICIALIFTNGSRGALLMLALFIGLMTISNIIDSHNTSYKLLKVILIIVCILILYFCGEWILQEIASILHNFGIQSRSLDLFLSGDISDNSGRDSIWAASINGILEGGIFGNGVFGDRPFVFPLHYAAYSHNIILEIVCSFGVIGIIICILLAVGAIRMIFFCPYTKAREMFIIFFSIASQLFLSLSFWYVWEFWAAIAIAYKYFQISKEQRINKRKVPK